MKKRLAVVSLVSWVLVSLVAAAVVLAPTPPLCAEEKKDDGKDKDKDKDKEKKDDEGGHGFSIKMLEKPEQVKIKLKDGSEKDFTVTGVGAVGVIVKADEKRSRIMSWAEMDEKSVDELSKKFDIKPAEGSDPFGIDLPPGAEPNKLKAWIEESKKMMDDGAPQKALGSLLMVKAFPSAKHISDALKGSWIKDFDGLEAALQDCRKKGKCAKCNLEGVIHCSKGAPSGTVFVAPGKESADKEVAKRACDKCFGLGWYPCPDCDRADAKSTFEIEKGRWEKAFTYRTELEEKLKVKGKIAYYETPHFRFYTDAEKNDAQQIVTGAEELFAALSKVFDVQKGELLWNGKCPIYYWSGQPVFNRWCAIDDASPACGGYFKFQGRECHVVIFNPDALLVGGKPFYFAQKTLWHEGTHAFLQTFDQIAHIKPWIHEGVAQHFEFRVQGCPTVKSDQYQHKEALRQTLMRDECYTVEDMMKKPVISGVDHLAYACAWSMVDYFLQLPEGPKKFRKMIELVKRGEVDEKALEQALAMKPAQFDEKWEAWARTQYRATKKAK